MTYREIIELTTGDDDDKKGPSWTRWTKMEIALEILALMALVMCFGLWIYYWGRVDDEIPVYFIYGVAMSWFSKTYLMILPFISLVLWVVMSLYVYLTQKDVIHRLKYQKFARMQYQIDRFFLTLIKMEVMMMLAIIERRIIRLAMGGAPGVDLELPAFAIVLILTLVRYIVTRSKIT
jgi:hypothetical protein